MKAHLVFIAIFALALPAYAQKDDGIIISLVDGNEYRTMSSHDQTIWFAGVLDGIMAESLDVQGELFRAGRLANSSRPGTVQATYGVWMGHCIQRYSVEQFHAVFNKRLEQQPENWHVPAALIVRRTVVDLCLKWTPLCGQPEGFDKL